jgi:hypothetical protein
MLCGEIESRIGEEGISELKMRNEKEGMERGKTRKEMSKEEEQRMRWRERERERERERREEFRDCFHMFRISNSTTLVMNCNLKER